MSSRPALSALYLLRHVLSVLCPLSKGRGRPKCRKSEEWPTLVVCQCDQPSSCFVTAKFMMAAALTAAANMYFFFLVFMMSPR